MNKLNFSSLLVKKKAFKYKMKDLGLLEKVRRQGKPNWIFCNITVNSVRFYIPKSLPHFAFP